MENRYKLIISNKNLYKEIELSPEMSELRIGTSSECDVRLRKELFFAPIELILQKKGSEWNLRCSSNLYFTIGDVRKLLAKNLIHGDELAVKYQEFGNDVFSLSFMIDFDYEKKEFDTRIDLSDVSQVRIGGEKNCNISFSDYYLGNDFLTLTKRDGKVMLQDNHTKYGVYLNGVRITNEAEVKEHDFFSIVGFSFYYKDGVLFTTDKSNMSLIGLIAEKVDQHSSCFAYPKFNRNSRIQYVQNKEELEIQQPKTMPTIPRRNIVLTLIPSIVMLAMTIVLRGIIGGGGTFVIYSAVSMSIGILMSIISYLEEKKRYRSECQKRIEAYNDYINDKKRLIEDSRENELRIRKLTYQSVKKSIQEANSFGKSLFERDKVDEDFLQVYLGDGKIESLNQVKYNKPEFIDLEDPLATISEDVATQYRYIDSAPIISDFRNSNSVGIIGSHDNLKQFIGNITLDLSIRQFYKDVKLVYILSDGYYSELEWVRWLHNVENENLDLRNIVCDEESKNFILEDLYVTLSLRENMLDEKNIVEFEERYIVFITNTSAVNTHPISKFFKKAAQFGFTFVFLEEHEEKIPQGCKELIRINSDSSGSIIKTENGDSLLNFTYPSISRETAIDVAKKLSAISVEEVSLEGELTKNITLFEMLNIYSVEDIDLEHRWTASEIGKGLAAPLGVRRKNQIVYLDISDKKGAHGPHGLVAGTTGSGKSEILQTYILSMATLYHPYEVGFVLIDFKGGGMANQFKNLPHLVGTITNIDGREINRSLLSIKAELVKRQELFSEKNVNHINDYIKLYKAGEATVPLPHLIMIVDEFAELKAEHPDFMKELISAARIGRTLGVHLILATQKPAGVVDAQIWSNSNFKLCLKVQTKEDSNEVLKTPLASEIVEPGRAYFQVGNNEIFELIQSAYSGADISESNDNNERTYAIYERNLWGKKTLKYTNKQVKAAKNERSQLQAIVDYVFSYCEQKGIDRLPGICLPSLAEMINTAELNYFQEKDAIYVPIGMYDDPEQQKQGSVDLDLSRNNVYIVGSAQMGKTTMIQTIAYGLIHKYTPQEVNLYMVDCGSMVLKIFEESAHVGGVVLSHEDEKCKNLFKLLKGIIVQRKKILSSKGVGSYSAYIEGGYKDMPLIVVAIDNLAAFKEYFPNQAEDINSITRESLSVGISFVITATTANALNYRTQANFGRKFVLNCNDANEYSSMFGHCKMTPKECAGRGLFLQDKRVLEYQVAMFGNSNKEAVRSQELKEYITERNSNCTVQAVKIPMIPEKLVLENIIAANRDAFRNKGILPIGMNFATVDLTSLNVNTNSSLALIGDAASKKRFLQNLVDTISRTIVFHDIEAIVIDDKTEQLNECKSFGFVRQYTADTGEGLQFIDDFCDDVMERSDLGDHQNTYIMLIINNNDVFKRICSDKAESKRLAEVIRNANEAGAFIIFANVENQNVGFNASEIMKAIKEERHGILFAQLADSKLFDVSGRTKYEESFDDSMGYFFNGNSYSKIKFFS